MNPSSRREFLKQSATLSACACCFGAMSLLDSCATTKGISATETTDMLSIPANSFATQNFITVQSKKFEEPIFIGKQPDGSYVALRMFCTHKGCALKAAPDKLVCPCHGSEFTTAGAVTKGPATTPLQSFKVTADSQSIIVHFN